MRCCVHTRGDESDSIFGIGLLMKRCVHEKVCGCPSAV